MARKDYNDQERAGAKAVLREALFTYMDTVEPDDSGLTYDEFDEQVTETLTHIEWHIYGRLTPITGTPV